MPIACCLALLGGPDIAGAADEEGERYFREQVEPILKAHCYSCHSHAARTTEGGLTLDSRHGWQKGGGRGPAIIPGDPAKSLFVRAVRRIDDDLQMPPDDPLPAEAVQRLVDWVRRGAPDPRRQPVKAIVDAKDWWSLKPIRRPDVPSHGDSHPIDAFIDRRLKEHKLQPLPEADRTTLIRRAYFDLHGLPPTPTDVRAFLEDDEPHAFERLVDRLLESPRYGERWARHWLDTIHFADSHGCEHDVFRPNAWRFRDYVIESLNNDTPWTRFIKEQLAADQFFPTQPALTAALGFIAAGPLELSRAGTAPVTFDYLDRDDMVTQTLTAFASTTANCARCHDHKFDPITQEDYYALQAVFAGVGKGDVEYDSETTIDHRRRELRQLVDATEAKTPGVLLKDEYAETVSRWEQAVKDAIVEWKTLRPTSFMSSDGAVLTQLDDNSILASGPAPDKDTYTVTAPSPITTVRFLRLDVLADDRLPVGGPGRQQNGNLHLSEFELLVSRKGEAEPERVAIRRATADWDQSGWTIAHALDGNVATAWGIYPRVGESHRAVFELDQPLEVDASVQLVVRLKQLHGQSHLIGRFRLSVSNAKAAAATVLPDEVVAALRTPKAERTTVQRAEIAAVALREFADDASKKLPEPDVVYAISNRYSHGKRLDAPMETPKVVHVLRRGDIEQPGSVAQPGALSVIESLPGRFEIADDASEAERRKALANWLAAPENPLTWRSIVNRVWAYHFGTGISQTPNDFGRMGDLPSHPELLDWLSAWFRDDAGGSLKRLHRLILTSAAWRRESRTVGDVQRHRSLDRDNRWLWRGAARPLDAESYRDAILQISGRIDLTMGGPGIQQFVLMKTGHLTPKLDYDAFDWSQPAAARRSIYRVVWRGIPDPFMDVLDFPNLGVLTPQRASSVSALQALTLFNNDFTLHHSEVLARHLAEANATLDGQVEQACRRIFLRMPRPDETALLVAYAKKHGLPALCRVLFNSNEFLFVE